MVEYSVMVPVWNEEKNIKPFYGAWKKELTKLKGSWEILYIDDGSTDGTEKEIEKLAAKDKRVKALFFREHIHKSAAYSTAFQEVNGKIVFIMDVDLQEPVSRAHEFVEEINKGKDVVIGWRKNRYEGGERKLFSKIFNFASNKLVNQVVHDGDCGYRAMKKEVVRDLFLQPGMHRFIPVLVNKLGYSLGEVKVEHFKRKFGTSKYGFKRLLSGLFCLGRAVLISWFVRDPKAYFKKKRVG